MLRNPKAPARHESCGARKREKRSNNPELASLRKHFLIFFLASAAERQTISKLFAFLCEELPIFIDFYIHFDLLLRFD
jgi:hypothetical protein